MKNVIKSLLVLSAIVIPGFTALAVSGNIKHPHHEGPGPEDQDRPPHPGRPHEIEIINNYSGKISNFLTNDDQMYDGFSFSTNGSNNTIKFPPHLAKKVMDLAKTGDNVIVGGITKVNREGVSEIRMVTLSNGSNTIFDTKPTKKDESNEKMVNIEGKIESLKLNKDGKVTGLYLKDNTILKLPPHAIDKLGTLLVKGENIKAMGILKNDEDGFVFAKNTRLIEGRIITIKDKTYLIR